MNTYGLSMNVLHSFLDTARAYLDLARSNMNTPLTERHSITRLRAVAKPVLLEIESRKNVPA